MGTDVLKSYDSLQQELEKAKSHLHNLNDNIRRIVGRDPQDTHLRGDRKRNFNDSRRNDFNNTHDRPRNRDSSPTATKRRPQEAKSVFSRLSGPPPRDEEFKPKIHSRVIRELPTRQEIVAAQGTDEQSRARNRRMFGCLLGTLQKFCQEESRLKQKEDMKAQIERKVEEQEIQERENMKKERQSLFIDRKRQQNEIRKLELTMNHLREFEVWEKSKKELKNFLRTKSKPRIYYRPKVMNEQAEKRLAESRAELEREIEQKRAKMNDDIQTIENRFRIREDRNEHVDDKLPEEEAATKHDRRNDADDDDDSMYEQSDQEQIEPVEAKNEDHRQNSENKHRHHRETTAEINSNDTALSNATAFDPSLERDASDQFSEEYKDRKANNNDISDADNQKDNKSE